MSDNKHVVPRKNGWGVLGGKKASKVFMMKGEAMTYAKDLALRHNVCMVVHDEAGKFEKFECNPEMKDQHVIKKGANWAVVEERGEYISKYFDNKGSAMAYAYDLVTKHDLCMYIHDEEGKFQSVTCNPNSPGLFQMLRMKLSI